MQHGGAPRRGRPKRSEAFTSQYTGTHEQHNTSHRVRAEWDSWLQTTRWSHFVTLTTSELVSVDRLRRDFVHGFVRRVAKAAQGPLAWFYVIEPHADGERYHVHALLAHTESLGVGQLERAWKFGISRIAVYDPQRGAADYVSKYLAANPDHYDVSRRLLPRGGLDVAA